MSFVHGRQRAVGNTCQKSALRPRLNTETACRTDKGRERNDVAPLAR